MEASTIILSILTFGSIWGAIGYLLWRVDHVYNYANESFLRQSKLMQDEHKLVGMLVDDLDRIEDRLNNLSQSRNP